MPDSKAKTKAEAKHDVRSAGRMRRGGRETLLCLVLSALAAVGGPAGDRRRRLPDGARGRSSKVLLGGGEGTGEHHSAAWRAPRAVAALVFGAALGVAGAVFQSFTRNPLGSPGCDRFFHGCLYRSAAGADAGGRQLSSPPRWVRSPADCSPAFAVYLLAWRRGSHGFRLILVGIGVSAMLAALNQWLVLRAEIEVAMAAVGLGSRHPHGVNWSSVTSGDTA